MLIEFSIENFRSFKEKVTLSLLASSDKSLDNNLIKTDVLNNYNLLRSEVIYGANASGKSNIVFALISLKKLVMNSHQFQKGTKIDYSPFKLDEKCLSLPSKFEVILIKNNIRYVYGVSFTSEKIIDEYLYYYPEGRKALIFERKDTDNYRFTTDKKEQKFLSEKTLQNVLYLSNSTKLNYRKTSDVFDWFKDTLRIIGTTDHPQLIEDSIESLNKDKKLKEFILKGLNEADLGIVDISASIEKVSIEDLDEIEVSPEFVPFFKKNLMLQTSGEDIQLINMEIKTFHNVINEYGKELKISFDFEDESEGTKRLFSLIGIWIDVLRNGRILIVDELDTKLHHLLNILLIKLFHDPTQNKCNAQLIFTTHNTNLLDLDLFRRDQIWFTEKNPSFGNTDLYSLIEFSPRKDKNIQKGYLAGRYGAIPFIGDERIF